MSLPLFLLISTSNMIVLPIDFMNEVLNISLDGASNAPLRSQTKSSE
jgi:hypothetical protein